MTFNKKLLVGAIAGLLVSANAGAVVLGDPARRYAEEMIKPVTLTDPNDDVEFDLGYNFSPSEVRYGRFECTANIEIDTPVVTSGSADIAVGAVNGAGTPAIFFSLTAADPLGGATDGILMNVDATNTLLDNSTVNCAFSIYDQPSQAQAGGAAGRIYTTGFEPVFVSVPSFEFFSDGGQAIADVEAPTGAYTDFIVTGWNVYGTLDFSLVAAPPLLEDGSVVTMVDLFDADTSVVVEGDFSAANDAWWDAWGSADVLTDDSATFEVGPFAGAGEDLWYEPTTTEQIQESEYTATLFAVANPGFEIDDVGPIEVGEIIRNGTQLQAPLAQVPGGWISRIALTNTGSLARGYEITVFGEDGNTIATNAANMTGSIPAEGTEVIEVQDFLTGFTGGQPRATVIVTIAGPNNQIQGLYQIVNPTSGSISNHVMVRPGTN